MRLIAIGLFFLLCTLVCSGCQRSEPPPTPTAVPASPEPTLPIGANFVTVTPSGGTRAPAVTEQRATSAVPTVAATPATVSYVVQGGDTLVGIAAAYGVTLEEVLALNPGIQPELLLVGVEILLPFRQEVAAPVAQETDTPLVVEVAGLASYRSATGGTWVLGEVWNTGPYPIELIRVRVTVNSEDGEALASQDVWVTPTTVPAMGRAPFGVLFSDVSPDEATAGAEVVSGRQAHELGNRIIDLAAVDTQVTIGRSPIEVSGQIENRGQFPAKHISIVTTFYDDREAVTGFHEAIMDGEVGPGEYLPFHFTALPPGGRADSFSFAVQAVAVE